MSIFNSQNQNFKEIRDLLNEKLDPMGLVASVGQATEKPAENYKIQPSVLAIGVGKKDRSNPADKVLVSIHVLDERVEGVEPGTQVIRIKDFDYNHPEVSTYQVKIRIVDNESWDEERLLMDVIDIINIMTRNR